MARKEEEPLKIHATMDQALKVLVTAPKKAPKKTPKAKAERKGKR